MPRRRIELGEHEQAARIAALRRSAGSDRQHGEDCAGARSNDAGCHGKLQFMRSFSSRASSRRAGCARDGLRRAACALVLGRWFPATSCEVERAAASRRAGSRTRPRCGGRRWEARPASGALRMPLLADGGKKKLPEMKAPLPGGPARKCAGTSGRTGRRARESRALRRYHVACVGRRRSRAHRVVHPGSEDGRSARRAARASVMRTRSNPSGGIHPELIDARPLGNSSSRTHRSARSPRRVHGDARSRQLALTVARVHRCARTPSRAQCRGR
jgi:hypothetical protein